MGSQAEDVARLRASVSGATALGLGLVCAIVLASVIVFVFATPEGDADGDSTRLVQTSPQADVAVGAMSLAPSPVPSPVPAPPPAPHVVEPLALGEDVEHADEAAYAEARLLPEGVVTLRIAVFDDLGEPVGPLGLIVGMQGDPWLRREVETDAGGVCLVHVPPDAYAIFVNDDGAAAGFGHAVAEVDARTDTAPTIVIPRVASRLELVLLDTLGVPLVGREVTAKGPHGMPRDRSKSQARVTDADGVARWDDIIAGRWELSVDVGENRTSDVQRERFEVARNTTTRVEWRVETWGEIVVRLEQVPVLADLREVKVGRVRLVPPWESQPIVVRCEPGDVTVEAVWAAASPWSWPLTTVEVPRAGRVEITIEPASGALRMAGFVVDERGTPVEGVSVMASVGEPDTRSVLVHKSATSDRAGAWDISGLLAGMTLLHYDGTRAPTRYLGPDVRVGDEDIQRALRGERLELVVVPGVRLEVHVPETWLARRADEGADVDVLPIDPPGLYEGQTLRSRADEQGVFVLEHRLPGLYLARLAARGGDVLAEQEFRVDDGFAEGETVRVDLVDDEGATGR